MNAAQPSMMPCGQQMMLGLSESIAPELEGEFIFSDNGVDGAGLDGGKQNTGRRLYPDIVVRVLTGPSW